MPGLSDQPANGDIPNWWQRHAIKTVIAAVIISGASTTLSTWHSIGLVRQDLQNYKKYQDATHLTIDSRISSLELRTRNN